MAAGRKDNHQIFPINLLCFGCSLLTVGINNLWRDRPDFLICCSKNKRQTKVLIVQFIEGGIRKKKKEMKERTKKVVIDSSSRAEYEFGEGGSDNHAIPRFT